MANEACPLPQPPRQDEQSMVERMLRARRIAVVGASDSPVRPSNGVTQYMINAGYDIVPVNPRHKEVHGRTCYSKLAEVPQPIDVVNVFRRSEDCPQVVREAIAAGAKGIWIQMGIFSDESRRLAQQAGIDYVEDRCIMVDHMSARRRGLG